MYNYNQLFDSKQKSLRHCKGPYRYSEYDSKWWTKIGYSSKEYTYCDWCIKNGIIDVSNCKLENMSSFGTNCDSYVETDLTTLTSNDIRLRINLIDGGTNEIPVFIDKTKPNTKTSASFIMPTSCEYYLNIDCKHDYIIKCYVSGKEVQIKNYKYYYRDNLKLGNFSDDINNNLFFCSFLSENEKDYESMNEFNKPTEIKLHVYLKKSDLIEYTKTQDNLDISNQTVKSPDNLDDHMNIDNPNDIDMDLHEVIEFNVKFINNQDDDTLFMDNMQYYEKKIEYLQELSDTHKIMLDEYKAKAGELRFEINNIDQILSKTKIKYDEYILKAIVYKPNYSHKYDNSF